MRRLRVVLLAAALVLLAINKPPQSFFGVMSDGGEFFVMSGSTITPTGIKPKAGQWVRIRITRRVTGVQGSPGIYFSVTEASK